MNSLFNPTENSQMIQRINKLTSSTQAQWGKMNVAQMLAHTHIALQSALGEVKIKRSFLGVLVGGMAKKKLLNDEPFKKNLPTDKRFVIADQRNFDQEKKSLVGAVQRFAQMGPNGLPQEPHPFFGKLSTQEWDKLMWKHLDHHLRQFGA